MMTMTSPGGITAFLKAVGLLVFMIYRHVQSELIVKPMHVEAVVGGGLTFFNCSTSLSSTEIHWFHYADGDTKDRSFVYGYDQFYSPYLGRFQMEKNPTTGAYDLIIPSVTIADAGRYECQDDAGRGDKASAELTVLDGNPECQSNLKPEGLIGPNNCGIDPDELHLTCAVHYHGNQPPILQWKEAGSDNPIAEGVTRYISSNRVIYYLKMEANSRLDGSSFQCVTTRSTTSQYNCSSEVVIIKGVIKREICVWETFNATCRTGTVIFIQRALYGRMRNSRCIAFENTGLDCYANVQLYLERQCNGQSECRVWASDQQLTSAESSCPKRQKPYLEVEYTCTRGFSCLPFQPPEGANIVRTSSGYLVTCPDDTNTKELLCRDGSWSKDPKKICPTHDLANKTDFLHVAMFTIPTAVLLVSFLLR